jgi:GNAT superfamily N-acetyltransferase
MTRTATPLDISELVRLRLALQREVGDLPKGADPAPQEEAIRRYLEATLPTGEFRAWVAEAGASPARLVACSGLVLFRRPPSRRNLTGWEGYLMNMYTEPGWRGRGLATALLGECVAYARLQTPARRIRLHATAAGRAVYERAGFVLADADMPEMVLSW